MILVSGWAITPMEYYNSLVAGGDEPGYRDGSFVSARFNDPRGLAFDETGHRLYVADSGNQRIREVDLSRNNEVRTLAGNGAIGSADGPFSNATFNLPSVLAALPGNRLALFDSGNGMIRILDLQNQLVSTVARGVTVQDMVYRDQDDSLYFSEPYNKAVEKLDMKSLVVSTLISNKPQVPSPGALCLFQDHLCVADSQLPTIYEIKLDERSFSSADPVSLSPAGNAKDVLALTSSEGRLYAIQKGGQLIQVGLPVSRPIPFPTAWGYLLKNQDYQGSLALLKIRADHLTGFSTSPLEPRKLFISTENSIVSVKDYDFEKWWMAFQDNASHLTDFDYPAQKPERTFRILMIGTSRNSTAVPVPSDPNADVDEHIDSPRVFTYTKRLEFQLNAEAALRNENVHYEILNLTHRGEAISTFGYYEVPGFVKKYDIDLVLGLVDQTGYTDYYSRPMTSDGIPAKSVDHEYSLQPLSRRAISGVALDLIERCKKLKIPISEKQDFPGDGLWSLFCNGDPQIQNDLKEMTGRRLQLLHEKLKSMRTSGGNCPQLVLFYAPGGALPNDCCASFWNDVCAQYRLKFLDLSEPFNALKISYCPAYADHFTAYGNELVALLLDHYLTGNKLIPF